MAENGFFTNRGVDVQVTGLAKSYRTSAEEVRALKGIDWRIAAGEAIALMGPSGCGKTTLLNILGGVDHPSSGEIVVGGDTIGALGERELERYRLLKIGFVFQFFNLIPTLTAFENLELPMLIAGVAPSERARRCAGLLGMVGLAEKMHKRPEELSGGEQQRVAVALALANDPALIPSLMIHDAGLADSDLKSITDYTDAGEMIDDVVAGKCDAAGISGS